MLFTPQDALATAKSAFTASIEFADAPSRDGAWAAAERQLAVAFEGLLERIRRQEAERQLAFGALLIKATAAGLEALDRQGLLERLVGCSDEEQAVELVQVSSSIRSVGLLC